MASDWQLDTLLVQILVVVADTQEGNLRAEEEKGLMRTVVGHE